MRYKIISAMLGASLVAAAVSGCGASNKNETEAPSVSLDGVEIVGESESETESEEVKEEVLSADESEPETLELDLYKKPSGIIEEDETEENGLLVENETESESEKYGSGSVQTEANQMKPQGIEEETERRSDPVEETELIESLGTYQAASKETPAVTEKETEHTGSKKETEKTESGSKETDQTGSTKNKSTEKAAKPAETETSGRKQTESGKKETESGEKETESGKRKTESKKKETESEKRETGLSEKETESEKNKTSADIEKEIKADESETKKETEQNRSTEKEQTEKTETAASEKTQNTEPQSESETETVAEMEPESVTETETETELESETETVVETELESETEIVAETQSESETETETETESETETETESESEAENVTETETLSLDIVADRVNVREEPSTDAEIQNLVTMGARVIVLERESNGWARIKYESEDELAEGYIKSEYLIASDHLRTVDERIRIRKAPGTEEEQIGQLEAQDEVLVLSEGKEEWTEILFNTEEKKVLHGYVKTEFLKEIDLLELNENIVEEYKRLLEAGVSSDGNHPEDGIPSEPESDAAPETTSETTSETVTGDIAESESAAETEDTAESELAAETEDTAESESAAETEDAAESESEDRSGGRLETESENIQSESEETEQPGTEAAKETDATSENESGDRQSVSGYPTETVDAQIHAAQQLIPGVSRIGMIYTEGDKGSEALAKRYLNQAAKEGIEVSAVTIIDELDIDLVASELAGNVEGILCLDDETMNGLVENVAAYADEVGIPVIGFEEGQLEKGCAAAVDHGTLYFSQKELDRLGITLDFDSSTGVER